MKLICYSHQLVVLQQVSKASTKNLKSLCILVCVCVRERQNECIRVKFNIYGKSLSHTYAC